MCIRSTARRVAALSSWSGRCRLVSRNGNTFKRFAPVLATNAIRTLTAVQRAA